MEKNNTSNENNYYRPWENLKESLDNGKTVLRLPEKVVKNLEHKHYGVYGHSAVQICSWTKKSIAEKGTCYKEKFYGIECHSCMEFSPAAMWCQQNCTFCWRPMEFMKNIEIKEEEVDEPKIIFENLLEKRKKLISGMGGHPEVNKTKFNQSFKKNPSHYAISLSGEPTMYPKLDKMIEYLKTIKETKTIFLVTNAQIPEFFEKLINNPNAEPTQLYISLDAPNKELFDKINISLYKDGWERLNKSLILFSKLKTRRILRFTQIKNKNDLEDHLEGYKKLIEKGKPDFIEIKAFMYLGMSRERHNKEEMPDYTEVLEFTKKLSNYLNNYEYVASAPNSRITLLKRKNSKYNLKIEKFEN